MQNNQLGLFLFELNCKKNHVTFEIEKYSSTNEQVFFEVESLFVIRSISVTRISLGLHTPHLWIRLYDTFFSQQGAQMKTDVMKWNSYEDRNAAKWKLL